MSSSQSPRIAPGGRRDVGLVNHVLCLVAGRVVGGPPPRVFTTLARHQKLFRGWLLFSGRLMPRGLLPRQDTELLILFVADRRGCEYEAGHHRRIGRRVGLIVEQIDHAGDPGWSGWTSRQRVLLAAADQLLTDRVLDDARWADLAAELDERECIELLMLVGQYDALASTLMTLRVQPER